MSEQLLLDDDYRSFDRSIGMEAALSINAVVTDTRVPYAELQAQSREGGLAPHIGSYLLRAEETADRHIGRRPENDSLFTRSGATDGQPAQLEPWSPQRAIYKDMQPLTETHLENRAVLQQKILEVTEPVYNAFLDKLPQQPSRWGRADKAITWHEQAGIFSYNFELTPNKDRSFGYSQAKCTIKTPDTYCGVQANMTIEEGRPTLLKTAWWQHMDFNDELAVLNTRAPGLLAFIEENGMSNTDTLVTVDFANMSLSLDGSLASYNQGASIRYRFDNTKNHFVANKKDHPPLSTDTFIDLSQKMLSLLPTIEVGKP